MGDFEDPRIHSVGVTLEAVGRLTRILEQTVKGASDLSLSEFEALLRLTRSGGQMPMGELATRLALTTGGITRLVDRLVRLGFVARVSCEKDRRVQWATITKRGRARLDKALGPHLEGISREFVDRMSSSELDVVITVMERLAAPL